ncbi:MAG: LPS export ABC transporter permease LptF [Coxiellaceae bacterium]|nr:MAG: LPS export ABC transporter permease LptF [Coxiellaceae bacterium]
MIVFRYLTKEVYATILATTIILLLILISNQFIHYLNRAAAGGLPPRAVMQLMSLQVPLLLGYLLPLGLFLGILLAYGRMYVDNEMTVLSACGFSKAQLIATTLGFSVFIAIMVAFLTLWLQPKLASYRDHIYAQAAAASPLETLFPGRFVTLDSGRWVLYVEDVTRDRRSIGNVFVAKMPDQLGEPWTIVSANAGHQMTDKETGDEFLVLTDGSRYTGVPGQNDFQIVNYKQYGVRIQVAQPKMRQQAEQLPTIQLWQKRNDIEAAAELQWRLAMPVATIILALLGVAMSRVRPRYGRFANLLPAILLYVVYADLIFVSQAAIQKARFHLGLGCG